MNPTPPTSPTASELAAWMKNHNLSNQALADIFGVSRAYISQMRNGHREMNRFQWDWLKRNIKSNKG